MRILFDQGTPRPLRASLSGHEVFTAYRMGWAKLRNGDLLNAAEAQGFTIFVTTDKNLKYQQNLTTRRISIIVLPTTRWPQISKHAAEVADAVNRAKPGSYEELLW